MQTILRDFLQSDDILNVFTTHISSEFAEWDMLMLMLLFEINIVSTL